MKRKDWNLLVLAAAGGNFLTPVQLQKVLFLISKKLPDEVGSDFYNFIPYDYGAFDATVYQDAEALALEDKACLMSVPGQRWLKYAATPRGLEEAKQLKNGLDGRVVEYIKALVDWAMSLSFQELVRAVYKAYPETKVNSVFQE